MNLAATLQTIILLAIGIAVGIYAWRGIRQGKIWVGTRGGREVWMVRSQDPVSYWAIIVLLCFAAVSIFWVAITGTGKLPIPN